MSTSNPTLNDSVVKAFTDAEKLSTDPVESKETPSTDPKEGKTPTTDETVEDEVVTETKEEPVVEEPTREESDLELDATPDEITNGLALFRALSDPKTRVATLKEIAKQSGITIDTPAEVKKLERDAKTVLKEKLGDNYELLSGDKIAEALEEIISKQVTEKTKPALDQISETQRLANEQKANTEMDSFFSRNKIEAGKRETVAEQMMQRMQRMPPAQGVAVNEYLDDIYHLVTKDAVETKTVKKVVTRIKANAQEVSRTSGEGGSVQESRTTNGAGTKLPSLDQAVKAGFRGEKIS